MGAGLSFNPEDKLALSAMSHITQCTIKYNCVVLCCVVLCCIVLFCIMLCCIFLCCVLCCVVLCCVDVYYVVTKKQLEGIQMSLYNTAEDTSVVKKRKHMISYKQFLDATTQHNIEPEGITTILLPHKLCCVVLCLRFIGLEYVLFCCVLLCCVVLCCVCF